MSRDTLPPDSLAPVVFSDLCELRLTCVACGAKQVWALPEERPGEDLLSQLACYACGHRALVYDLSSLSPVV